MRPPAPPNETNAGKRHTAGFIPRVANWLAPSKFRLPTKYTKPLGTAVRKYLPRGVKFLASKSPLGTPIMGSMEGLDYVGGLPEWAGGTGAPGWSPELEYRQESSPFGADGSYSPAAHLNAMFTGHATPVRGLLNIAEGVTEIPEFFRQWARRRELNKGKVPVRKIPKSVQRTWDRQQRLNKHLSSPIGTRRARQVGEIGGF